MTRSVECVLVGTGDKASSDAIEVMKELVLHRFNILPVVFDGPQATKDHVTAAVTGAARRCRSGGLFLLMFSGHGGFGDDAHYWQLVKERLRDVELLKLLGHFDLGVEIVVVSDCCYGAGMLHAGLGAPRGGEVLALAAPPRARWEVQLRDRWDTLVRAATTERPELASRSAERAGGQRPIVLISATDWLMIRSSVKNQFIRALAAAVDLARTYGELREKMVSVMKPEGQSNWNVHSEPAEALELAPLAPLAQ